MNREQFAEMALPPQTNEIEPTVNATIRGEGKLRKFSAKTLSQEELMQLYHERANDDCEAFKSREAESILKEMNGATQEDMNRLASMYFDLAYSTRNACNVKPIER